MGLRLGGSATLRARRDALPLRRLEFTAFVQSPDQFVTIGAAYLIPGKPHYTRFKVIAAPQPEGSDAPPIPAYQPMPKLR